MDIIKYNKTFTTKFILPLLFKQNTDYSELFNNSFINAYVGDIKNKEYDDKILVVFNDYPPITVTQTLLSSVTEYKEDDKYVFVFDLPEIYTIDYYNFLAGRYDQFSDHTKDKILKFWQCNKDSLLYSVLSNNKDAIRKYISDKDVKIRLSDTIPWFPPVIKNEILGVN